MIAIAAILSAVVSAGDTLPKAKDRGWKVVAASVEGPEGRAVEFLTGELGPLMLRDSDLYTFRVLPVELEGRVPIAKRHRIVLGTWKDSACVRSLLKAGDVPKGGYYVRASCSDDTNVVVIVGDRPVDVLYGAVDFIEDGLVALARQNGDGIRYRSQIFDGSTLGWYESRRAPKTSVRSLFTWGHVVDDYRLFFHEMARLKLNRVILWNDYPPLNAKDVVDYAHSWGIEVFWGFPWGWDTDCRESGKVDQTKLAATVLDDWRRNWKDLPGDGVYFQTFTETTSEKIEGETVAARAVKLVNKVAGTMLAEKPSQRIVFGLHAMSVKDDLATIAKVDRRLEILWENCGGFPHQWCQETTAEADAAFVDKILATTHNAAFALKCQLLQDWDHWEHQAGPFLLGCAGSRVMSHDKRVAAPLLTVYDVRWIAEGERAHSALRRIQNGAIHPVELNTVTEYNPPFSLQTALMAELMWNADEDYAVVRGRVLNRVVSRQ